MKNFSWEVEEHIGVVLAKSNMKKYIKKKFNFHWTHLAAVAILAGYFIISKLNLAHALSNQNLFISFIQLFAFGTIFTYLFLYIYSHEKFFPFAREIEKKEESKEKGYLKKYLHHGKMLATFLIGIVGGPIFLSLTIRLLLNNFRYRYLYVFIISFFSTVFTFILGKGFINIFI